MRRGRRQRGLDVLGEIGERIRFGLRRELERVPLDQEPHRCRGVGGNPQHGDSGTEREGHDVAGAAQPAPAIALPDRNHDIGAAHDETPDREIALLARGRAAAAVEGDRPFLRVGARQDAAEFRLAILVEILLVLRLREGQRRQ